MIRVTLPAHLRNLAQVTGEVRVEVSAPVTQAAILEAVETMYPMLKGTIRDQITLQRRPFLRFFVCQEDWSHEEPTTPDRKSVV